MRLLVSTVLAVTLAGCENFSSTPKTLEGAWMGEGAFHSRMGQMDVKAQLELLSDGTYRYLILEPGILTMTGPENGDWQREDQTLTLTPVVERPDPPAESEDGGEESGKSALQGLQKGFAASERPQKTLTIADNLSKLEMRDGKIRLTFKPNPEATAKLISAGEVSEN
jgi:hypothetical protein